MELEIITAESVNAQGIQERYYTRLQMAESLIIESPQDVEQADSILVGLAADIQAAKLALKPMRDSTTAAWKAGTELENRLVKPLEEAKKLLSTRRGQAVAMIQEQAAQEAARLMDEGDFDTTVPAPVIEKSGVTSRETYAAECSDFARLVQAAGKDPERFQRFLKLDESALNAEAKFAKEHFSVPGCKLVKSFSSTVRTGPAKSYNQSYSTTNNGKERA